MNKRMPAGAETLIVELVRGHIVESEHRVSVAMVDAQGRRLLDFGETSRPTYLRSSAKPFQALPFVEEGHAESLSINAQQLAILCASHSGTDEHAELVGEILKKCELAESHLRCGTHTPTDKETAIRLLRQGVDPTALRHNCSGKHAGMLLFASRLGTDLEGYLDHKSVVQRRILETFAEMTGMSIESIGLGVDGCSAPNFAVPLTAAALGYARLMDPSRLSKSRAEACRLIVGAMTSNPVMVAGTGRFDTELMLAVEGRLLAKGGAEGYQAIGIPRGQLPSGEAAGLVLKVHDGDLGKRAGSLVTLAVLRILSLVSASELDQLSAFDARMLDNYSRLVVGEIRLMAESRMRLQGAYERI